MVKLKSIHGLELNLDSTLDQVWSELDVDISAPCVVPFEDNSGLTAAVDVAQILSLFDTKNQTEPDAVLASGRERASFAGRLMLRNGEAVNYWGDPAALVESWETALGAQTLRGRFIGVHVVTPSGYAYFNAGQIEAIVATR
jgi:hypothetical protein